MKQCKSSFYPIGSIQDKNNYKLFFRIEKDGTIIERVHLDIIDQRKRENIICLHYLQHYTKIFRKKQLGVNIIDRDSPWDFELKLSNGEILNLEITSIADGVEHFKANKREERYANNMEKDIIPLHELIKLNSLFPSQKINTLIKSYKAKNTSKNGIVKNPLETGSRIFISGHEPKEKLDVIIKSAIEKKSEKKHLEKEKTILIIDNRTSAFEINDLHTACKCTIESYPFREIWFYTGYFSDDDGNNAEYSFAGLKLTTDQQNIISNINDNKIDENGIYIC